MLQTKNRFIKKWLNLNLDNENSNLDERKYPFLISKLGTGALEKDFIENSPCKKEHLNGEIYLHNASEWWIPHCAGLSIIDVLMNGYDKTVVPPKHFDSALSQLLSNWYIHSLSFSGALAYSHFDTFLAPFIYRDRLSFLEVKKHLKRTLYFIDASIFRRGQSLFVNVTLDINVPKILEKQKIFLGFEDKYLKRLTYGDFQDEMDMFNRAFFELLNEGRADNTPFTFPLVTINYTEDIEKEKANEEVLNGLYKITAKYGIPYFRNLTRRFKNENYDVRSFCCHLLQNDLEMLEFSKKFNGRGLWDIENSFLCETGGINVININLNRIALESKGDFDKFFSILEKKLEKGREHLKLCKRNVEFLNKENRLSVKIKSFDTYFLIFSVIGGYEALKNMGINRIEEITKHSKEILNFIRKKLEKYMIEDRTLYGLEAAPSEKSSFYLGKKDVEYAKKNKLKKKVVSGIKYPWLTPGFNITVGEEYYYGIKHRRETDILFNSGTVFHIFHSQALTEDEAKRAINFYIKEELPYITISPTMSICDTHGVFYGVLNKCEKCNSPVTIIAKIVGYSRPIEQWGAHKKEELLLRPTSIKLR